MSNYKMRGSGLYNKNRRIAIARSNAVYDDNNRSIATIVGNDLYDSGDRRMLTVRGTNIYGPSHNKIASLSEAQESIEGTLGKMSAVALWYCFIR